VSSIAWLPVRMLDPAALFQSWHCPLPCPVALFAWLTDRHESGGIDINHVLTGKLHVLWLWTSAHCGSNNLPKIKLHTLDNLAAECVTISQKKEVSHQKPWEPKRTTHTPRLDLDLYLDAEVVSRPASWRCQREHRICRTPGDSPCSSHLELSGNTCS